MLRLTDNARAALTSVRTRARDPETGGLRIRRHRDREGFQVAAADAPKSDEKVLEDGMARVFLGPQAVRKFRRHVLDARQDRMGRTEFVVRDE